jgi:hypothetical protein
MNARHAAALALVGWYLMGATSGTAYNTTAFESNRWFTTDLRMASNPSIW